MKAPSLFAMVVLLTATAATASTEWSSERRKTEQKLDSIIIPRIHFKDKPVREALAFLVQQSKEHDQGSSPNERGIQMIVKLGSNTADTRIDLDLKNISLREALRYACMLAGLKFKVGKYRVVSVVPQTHLQDLD